MKFLEPPEVLKILMLRQEFHRDHSQTQTLIEYFSLLLEELKALSVSQNPPLHYERNNESQDAYPINHSTPDKEQRVQELFR